MARRLQNPDSYVPPKSAAKFLRQMADDLDKRPDNAWVSLRINSCFASQEDVERNLARIEKQQTRRSTTS